jgi:hypothetical protein
MAPVMMQFVRGQAGADTADKLEKALRAAFS